MASAATTKKTTKKTTKAEGGHGSDENQSSAEMPDTSAAQPPRASTDPEFTFGCSVANMRVGNIQFVRGQFVTSDPEQADAIRASNEFGKRINEISCPGAAG